MTWSSDFPPPPSSTHGRPVVPAAVEWSLEELHLEGVAFGGREEPTANLATPESAAERAQALDAAFREGYDEGRIAGEIAERARLESAVQAATRLLEELREREARWTERLEENICALAVGITRQLLDREAAAEPELTGDLVRRALAEFPIDQPVSIRVNPSDLASITAAAVADPSRTPTVGRQEAHWIPDARIAPGGCVIEGRDRIIDGRVDTALERLYRRLTYTGA